MPELVTAAYQTGMAGADETVTTICNQAAHERGARTDNAGNVSDVPGKSTWLLVVMMQQDETNPWLGRLAAYRTEPEAIYRRYVPGSSEKRRYYYYWTQPEWWNEPGNGRANIQQWTKEEEEQEEDRQGVGSAGMHLSLIHI